MPKVPFLIISDNPTSATGLGRITHDIAIRAHETIPELRVGVCGGGGTWSDKVPYALYPTSFIDSGYVVNDLPRIWRDFAGDQKGVVMTIWNHTWLDWLVRPERMPDGEMKAFLLGKPFEVWGYIPIDGERADGTTSGGPILDAFDRILAYTKYGADVIGKTIGKEVEHIGHGNDATVFYPRPRSEARKRLAQTPDDVFLVGCIATNTPRKDWGLAFETCAELIKMGENVKLWAHTDVFQRHWDLMEMARFYKVKTLLTNFQMSNEDMAWAMSACDVTLGIGSGEGWGMPLSESLACGVPVVTGNYAGATEFCETMVYPKGFRIDGFHMLKRPIYDPETWALLAIGEANRSENRNSILDPNLNWDRIWLHWREWITRGIPA